MSFVAMKTAFELDKKLSRINRKYSASITIFDGYIGDYEK